jgi:hypothetical protein
VHAIATTRAAVSAVIGALPGFRVFAKQPLPRFMTADEVVE